MEIIRKIFYLFAGGLITSALATESLKLAFNFSIFLGLILLISYIINQLAEYFEWAETIVNFLDELNDKVEDIFENIKD